VVYVGDSDSDLLAARAAGVRGAAVLWPKKPHEVEPFRKLARSLGAAVVRSPGDVPRLVGLPPA